MRFMPAVLVEITYHESLVKKNSVKFLFQGKIAKTIFDGLAAHLIKVEYNW